MSVDPLNKSEIKSLEVKGQFLPTAVHSVVALLILVWSLASVADPLPVITATLKQPSDRVVIATIAEQTQDAKILAKAAIEQAQLGQDNIAIFSDLTRDEMKYELDLGESKNPNQTEIYIEPPLRADIKTRALSVIHVTYSLAIGTYSLVFLSGLPMDAIKASLIVSGCFGIADVIDPFWWSRSINGLSSLVKTPIRLVTNAEVSAVLSKYMVSELMSAWILSYVAGGITANAQRFAMNQSFDFLSWRTSTAALIATIASGTWEITFNKWLRSPNSPFSKNQIISMMYGRRALSALAVPLLYSASDSNYRDVVQFGLGLVGVTGLIFLLTDPQNIVKKISSISATFRQIPRSAQTSLSNMFRTRSQTLSCHELLRQ